MKIVKNFGECRWLWGANWVGRMEGWIGDAMLVNIHSGTDNRCESTYLVIKPQ